MDNQFAGFRIASCDPDMQDAYLSDIAVAPQFRGMGIGTHLFNTAIENLKKMDCDWIWALVHEDNQHMQSFLEKRGFIRGRKFYYYYKDSLS